MAGSLYWAAGFFEGEGSATVYYKKNSNCKRFALEVKQADQRPLDYFRDAIGVGKVRGPYGPYKNQLNKKPIYIWRAVGQEAIEAAVLLSPLLFAKGEQVEAALNTYLEYKEGLNGPIDAT